MRQEEEANPTVVFVGPGQVEVASRPSPTPDRGEVLIRTRRSLISTGTEMTLLEGDVPAGSVWDRLRTSPRVPGYSNVGEVVATGPGGDPSWVGRVVHNHGPHQRLTVAPEKKLAAVPEGVSEEEATFATLAKVAMNGVRRGGVTWGESVVVFGLGIIGQIAARLCLLAGARPVFVVEPHDERRALLPDHPGFIALRAASAAARRDELYEHNRGRLADVVLDITGNPEVIPDAARLLRTGGRLVIVGSPRGPSWFDFHDLCNRESITILGAHSSHHPLDETPFQPFTSSRHGAIFLDLLSRRELSVAPLITHRFPVDRAADAYALLGRARQSAIGVILEW
jgi:2-desacetyl-2-hydroxyethyl bacteriochlorophyllide A dehydrogenase